LHRFRSYVASFCQRFGHNGSVSEDTSITL